MFAVPGWSLSPGLLKTQDASTGGGEGDQHARASRKRKRRQGTNSSGEVTSSNVADLWQQHVEGKDSRSTKVLEHSKRQAQGGIVQSKKSSKKIPPQAVAPASALDGVSASEGKYTATKEPRTKGKGSKELDQSVHRPAVPQPQGVRKNLIGGDPKGTSEASSNDKAAPKLTPLQAAMRQKLISARFRHLNETLYTAPSAESRTLFDTNPSFFTEYHEGFRQQVSTWPENPVEAFVADLQHRGRMKDSRKDRGRPQYSDATVATEKKQLAPLPRTGGCCTVADLGCGDAALAGKIAKDGKRLNVSVLSYDLQSTNSLVTKADISNLPLENGSIDVAIFCLALMGTNWIDFIDEAWRILHWKGELWVAEIKSRFGRAAKKQVEHSVGKRRKIQQTSGQREAEHDKINDQLIVEVDGADNNKQQTDVSAFVLVLQKRGFTLNGDSAVDLSNKMFVRLKFVKNANPVKGKNVKESEDTPGMKRRKTQFLDDDKDADTAFDEASILKPCLYKVR